MKAINKEIFRIAIPNIIGNITVPLIGIVDTMLMGYEGEKAITLIGAIALGGIIFNAIYWNFGFLRISVSGITAQAYGAKDEKLQALTLFRALLLGSVLAMIILSCKSWISTYGLSLITNASNQEAIGYAREYFEIRVWAVPAAMMIFAIKGWFYGMQNARFPLAITITINVINIIASWYFVRIANMSASGVAMGTVVAQYSSLILAFVLLSRNYSWIFDWIKWRSILLWNELQRFFFVSGFVLARNIMLFAVFSSFTYYSSEVGKEYFAVNQMLLELFYLMSFAVDGFAYASEALVGKYTGARDLTNIKKSIYWTMVWGVGFGIVYALSYLLFGVYFLRIFTPDWSLIEQGRPYIFWLSIISVVGAVAFIWDGIYIGATLVVRMFLSMGIATVAFFVVLFASRSSLPDHAVWLAMTVYMMVRGVMQWILFKPNYALEKSA